MTSKLMLFFLLFGALAWADSGEKVLNGYDPRVDIISEDYEAGPHLIYDCEKKAWICVLESYKNECLKKREQDIYQKKLDLRCAFITELPNKKSCFQKQLFMVSQNMGTRFCIHEEWQRKEIEL